MANDNDTRKLAIGRLGAPKGVRGDLRVHSYSGDFEHLLALRSVELVPGPEAPPAPVKPLPLPSLRAVEAAARGEPLPGDGARPRRGEARESRSRGAPPPRQGSLRLRVLRSEMGPGGMSMALEGYSTPEAAATLTGLDIVVPRSEASPLGENEWYIADLVGLELVAPGAAPGSPAYGKVEAVLEGGPDPWLETRLPGGSTVLVPFRKEFVGAIDVAGGRIELLAPWILE